MMDHICRKRRLEPGERFLDLGCGWGALTRWAAENYGVHATGVTLSRNQYEQPAPSPPTPPSSSPAARGGCLLFSPLKRAEAHVWKVHTARDDPRKLKKLARSGNLLGPAYAATLLLASEGKVPSVGKPGVRKALQN